MAELDKQDIKELIEEIKKSSDPRAAFRGQLGGLSASEQRQRTKQLKDEIALQKVKAKGNDELIKDLNQLDEALDETTEELKRTTESVRGFGRTLGKVGDTLWDLADAGKEGTDQFKTFTGMFSELPAFGGLIDKFGNSLDFNVDLYRQLATTGADFGQSLVMMRKAAFDMQLPLTEFAGVLADNTQTLSALFGTTQSGVQYLTAFSEELRRVGIPQVASLGITTENLNEFLGTYLERQRIQQRFGALTQAEVTANVIEYSKELDKLARLTGIQREQLDENVQAQQADSVFQAYLSGLNEDQAREAQNLVAAMTALDPALGDVVKNMIATGVPFGDLGEQLAGTSKGFMDTIVAFREGRIGAEEALAGLRDAGLNFKEGFDAQTLLFGGLDQAGNSLLKLSTLGLDLEESQSEQEKQAAALTDTLTTFNEAAKRLKASFESIQTNILTTFGPAITKFSDWLQGPFMGSMDSLINMLNKHPKMFAGAVVTALGGKFLFDAAKQTLIIAAGVKLGLLGWRAMFGMIGRGLGLLTKILAPLAIAIGAITSFFKLTDDDKSNNAQGIGELIGMALGGIAGFAVGGPAGAVAGAYGGRYLGGKAGDWIGGKELGGDVFSNTPTLVGERGPELFVPKTAGTIISSNNTQALATSHGTQKSEKQMVDLNNSIVQMVKINNTMVQHLNTLVTLGVMTERNTKGTRINVANLSSSIV